MPQGQRHSYLRGTASPEESKQPRIASFPQFTGPSSGSSTGPGSLRRSPRQQTQQEILRSVSSRAPESWKRDTRQTHVLCLSSPASLSTILRPSQGPTDDREAFFIPLQSAQLRLGDASICSLQGALIATVWGAFWVSPSHNPPSPAILLLNRDCDPCHPIKSVTSVEGGMSIMARGLSFPT